MMTSSEVRYNIHEINATKTAELTAIVFQQHFENEDASFCNCVFFIIVRTAWCRDFKEKQERISPPPSFFQAPFVFYTYFYCKNTLIN
jgi:hypothetical protein